MQRQLKAALPVAVAAILLFAAATRAARPHAAVALGCSAATAAGPAPEWAQPSFTRVGGGPFGVATARGYAFVSNQVQGLAVLADHDRAPHLIHEVSLPGQDELGMTITPDGRYLLVAGGSGAVVVDTAAAEAGRAGAVLGTLSTGSGGGGAIEVTTSRDGRYAFVSLEDSDRIAVYRLADAIADHFRRSAYVGAIPTGVAPVGLAVSPDGRWLYSTSEVASLRRGRIVGQDGSLSAISVAGAERDPAHATVATVSAGCQPVRVAVSADGNDVWVTARGSDELLAFSAAALDSKRRDALLTGVRVGAAPVGLALADGGTRVVVADSDRFDAPGATAAITIVSSAAALAHRPAIIGTVKAQQFPRDMAAEPAGSVVLVSNFGSGVLEALHVFDHAQESHGQ